jgi:hypothetical protein
MASFPRGQSLTGKPDAGDPPVRFGGRGGGNTPSLPLLYRKPILNRGWESRRDGMGQPEIQPFALAYLSRYTHRVGISNRRLLKLDREAPSRALELPARCHRHLMSAPLFIPVASLKGRNNCPAFGQERFLFALDVRWAQFVCDARRKRHWVADRTCMPAGNPTNPVGRPQPEPSSAGSQEYFTL